MNLLGLIGFIGSKNFVLLVLIEFCTIQVFFFFLHVRTK
jgi:hypothetical protein